MRSRLLNPRKSVRSCGECKGTENVRYVECTTTDLSPVVGEDSSLETQSRDHLTTKLEFDLYFEEEFSPIFSRPMPFCAEGAKKHY